MFNLCYRSDATNTLFRQLLMDAFKQLVTEAKQTMGRLNAHVNWGDRSPEEISDTNLYCKYVTMIMILVVAVVRVVMGMHVLIMCRCHAYDATRKISGCSSVMHRLRGQYGVCMVVELVPSG